MKKILTLNLLVSLNITSIVVLLDILSKQWVINHLSLFEVKPITSILNIFHTHNYGLAFSIFSNIVKNSKYFLYLLNILIIIIILKMIYSIQNNKIHNNILYTLIISGAIGNLIDRLRFGFVIDFIDIHLKDWHFATFNIADISILLGSVMMMYTHFNQKNK
ncbi:signal peptidase II [Buchnera aphidicola]|uniref:Lipoprotein signal peptidase n=1 Tax=Buchnera aphidicola subsp. Melaphis rhois TaxID=118103 RepID=A0A4D6YFN5_BUCMH|nr:signal peptidase II [Buchnera aphidicola]QCI23175.1 signal peptidase II [Buchnera aphidicola (Melaphis rhois)]